MFEFGEYFMFFGTLTQLAVTVGNKHCNVTLSTTTHTKKVNYTDGYLWGDYFRYS